MTHPAVEPSRRERNKQAKLDRITAAASTLFAEHGVDDVTTQQIAEAADIGAGTLFLYVRSKGELLLLVQNAHYADALALGMADAEIATTGLDAVMAILRPVVACNRVQVDNGRTYLREMAFGDPADPQRAAALEIVARTEAAVAACLTRHDPASADAGRLAHVISAVMFVELSTSDEPDVETLVARIREQVRVLVAH
ncbi:TetR/AcrR family transcriptional regulator [Cellulomonas sp. PhB150]|uniref:TetR/AcrR family transcriptional regulator n=1 Tax=Cellulomonas sp. PhB150 TaxID=2485188 RepID=UPI000F48628A|nr:TetR/AcrR family transcriptional regulator [Cellulomonas sp. PhB150]ROS30624.1 TetR family transcriptional regulator [Cellulomonas sp. PhB150]